ncbi:hypothetical protein BST27_02125 [Mycobacterium intermedium]|uniref:Diacylglycerol O-acyltransferase n=1 Tax=Mycobacterium intermedium TaxID=28445 RepID=A0A1E3SJE9_MYCIE|nr:hypothetical protein [Mycobacterium intermedium]ODR02231.1 hypothetical protein BHQ20_05885 [Mycobacterium intermedium]OPE46397.1 hypothetical protein BV508_26080 [Mycobacterium intermedium]ORB10141.1 hypothetical protein BST27_02125 [Mycobacterium intermedium]
MSKPEARQDNQLSFMDQAMFSSMRAIGRSAVVQCVWIYEHDINLAGLRRFHQNLGRGLLGRRIERSTLPFARDRWVCDPGPADIVIDQRVRPRCELSDWVDECAQRRVDPEYGPGWHLAMAPLTDGSTAVSLVASHCLIDGLGIVGAVADAASGKTAEPAYPPPRSRTRRRAIIEDARQTARDAPEIGRAVVAVGKMTRGRADSAKSTRPPFDAADDVAGHEPIAVPAIVIHIPADDWDARARTLRGRSHHLATGLAAKLGEYLGRRRADDGYVILQVPLSDRTEGDTRANTLAFVSVNVDPTGVTSDLTDTRAAIRKTFESLRNAPEQASPTTALSPLVTFAPKRLLKRVTEEAFAYADLPVACSSMGDLTPMAARPDGTEAEYVFGRGVIQGITREQLERTHGELALWFLRIGGMMCITVAAYQPGGSYSKRELRALVAKTLAEFDLNGVIE